MDFAEYKDILVVLELDEGKPVNVRLENIAAAKSVVNGGKVIAVTVCENAAKTAIEYGADSAIVIEGAQFEGYNADAVADAVAQIAAEVKPAAIFTGATGKGKDLVPRIAAKLATGSVCDATAVKLDEAGNVVLTALDLRLLLSVAVPYLSLSQKLAKLVISLRKQSQLLMIRLNFRSKKL